jgi:hypothetical protein
MEKTSRLRYDDNMSYDAKRIVDHFSLPIFQNKFFNNKNYLYLQSVKVPFDRERWYRRPEVFCLDRFEEHLYYPIILLLNNIGSRFSFVPENLLVENFIISPSKQSILKVLNSNN